MRIKKILLASFAMKLEREKWYGTCRVKACETRLSTSFNEGKKVGMQRGRPLNFFLGKVFFFFDTKGRTIDGKGRKPRK